MPTQAYSDQTKWLLSALHVEDPVAPLRPVKPGVHIAFQQDSWVFVGVQQTTMSPLSPSCKSCSYFPEQPHWQIAHIGALENS